MKKVFSLVGVLCLGLLLCSTTFASSSSDDVLKILKWILQQPEGSFKTLTVSQEGVDYYSYGFIAYEGDRSWRWKEHRLDVGTIEIDGNIIAFNYFWVDRFDWSKGIGGGTQQAPQWNLGDIDFDGVVDTWYRFFRLYSPEEGHIFPNWPKGLVNREWFNSCCEDAQAEFDAEVQFWCKFMEEGE